MVGAGPVVLVDPPGDGFGSAPRNEGVDEPVASVVGEVGVVEAVAAQVFSVVGERKVAAQVLAADVAGVRGIGRQYGGLFGDEKLAGAEEAAGIGGMFGRDQVSVGAVRVFGGEAEHARAESRQHPRRGGRSDGAVAGGQLVHGGEVVAHRV